MYYTVITLAFLGLFGIFIHNLKNLNTLNKKSEGNLNLVKYLKLEIYAILLSVCVVAVALIAQQEIKQLDAVYPFLGGTSSSCKWNLKDPRNLDAAFRLTFSGGWTFSSTGALPNGVNAYANTYWNSVANAGTTNASNKIKPIHFVVFLLISIAIIAVGIYSLVKALS